MPNLKFKKLELISTLAKAARSEEFHDRQTMILGVNSTGKSCFVKSLYWTFGAEPARFHGDWAALNVSGLLTFTLDGVPFQILRSAERFGLFDGSGKLMSLMDSITDRLAPRIGRMLDFELRLTNQQGLTLLATPAFNFMPFYIDQDEGWKQPWSSFDRVQQFKSWKKDTVDYHSGVKPRSYYLLIGKKTHIDSEISKLRAERDALDRAFKRLKQGQDHIPPPINRAAFKQEIGRLVDEVTALQAKRTEVTSKLSSAESKKAILRRQLAVAQAALKELDKDYVFATDVDDDPVQCPTCGTDHDNSFVNRFALVDDQQQCRHFIQMLQSELTTEESKSRGYLRELDTQNFRVAKIEAILEARRGKWRFQDMIDAEGQRRAFELIANELTIANEKLGVLQADLDEIKVQLKALQDPNRAQEIHGYFADKITLLLHRLNVHTLPAAETKEIRLTLHNTGSDQPRTVLAYYLAFGEVMRKFGSTAECPIVYDTPNQQDQDPANARRIVDCILECQPEHSQLILAAVSLQGVQHGGKEIRFTTEKQLLQPDKYAEVGKSFAPLLDQMDRPSR